MLVASRVNSCRSHFICIVQPTLASCFLKTLKSADASNAPAVLHQDAALVSFVGRLAPDPSVEDGPIFQTVTNWWVVVGDKDLLPALEMGIRFTKCGETSAIWSHSKFAYGPGTRTDALPANSSVRYEVTIHKVWTAAEQDQNSVKLEVCRSKKNIANDIYKNENVVDNPHSKNRALQIYKKAAENLDYLVRQASAAASDGNDLDFDVTEARVLLLDCLNNIAAVHLQCKSYHAAKESCVAVLEQDPNNFKALLRAAKAALLDPASSYEEVDAAIQAASEQCQDNEKLQIEVQRLKVDFLRRKQAHKQREKSMYSKMTKGVSGKESDRKEEQTYGDANEPSGLEANSSTHPILDKLKQLPWNRILPQLMLSLLMLLVFKIQKKRPEENSATQSATPEL